MNDINTPLVDPARIAKALRLNPAGAKRLAAFVCSVSTDPWRVFEACQQQRVTGLLVRSQEECRNRYVENRDERVSALKQLLELT